MRWLFSVVNEDSVFLSAPFPFPPQNEERAVRSYERHNQAVRDFIPGDRLLEYDVREGWEPLCRFLDVPVGECPSDHGVPFPRSNLAGAVRWQSSSAFMVPLMLMLFVMFSSFVMVFRRVTRMSVVGWCGVQRGGVASCFPWNIYWGLKILHFWDFIAFCHKLCGITL